MDVSDGVVDSPFLVVTGSSAGGIDALIAVVSGLSEGLNAAVVVAQHLDPMHESRLAEILAARSALPVKIPSADEKLQPGTIYVVPPNRDVEITDGHAAVFPADRSGPKPSIDKLFKSAAGAYGDRLIAVILSGMGNDGVAGARMVKEQSGTVIVQDPETAAHPSMPLAIPPTLVDVVADPRTIGQLIADLVRGSAIPVPKTEQNVLRGLLTQLRDRSGIDFLQYKTPTIMRRVSRLMVASGANSVADYTRHLQAHPDEYSRLASAFLIKVTEFFRDAALFTELRERVLPRLIAEARARGSELRIWSAGTSTGEEAYSLAILCAEILRDDVDRVPVRIFATDLSEQAIAFARHGVYAGDALRHVPDSWIDRYFVRNGETYEVSKLIRYMTVFGQHDLAQRAPFPRIDLCMCRNVLIYFTRQLQQRALQLFAFSLHEGGFLVLGKAETTNALTDYFRLVNPALKLYQRQGERVLIPPMRMREAGSDPAAAARAAATQHREFSSQRNDVRPTTTELLGFMLGSSQIGAIAVDRRYDILAINTAARKLLAIHGIGVGEDLIHLAKTLDSNRLRSIIDAAFRNEFSEQATLETSSALAEEEGPRWISVTCVAENHHAGGRGETLGVLLTDVTEAVQLRAQNEQLRSTKSTELDAAAARAAEAQKRLNSLVVTNTELTEAHVALRSVNEQLVIGAEESASASEEIETLNEEMQATNEELETLNEELQATVEELNTTNDELGARGAELEDTIVQREVAFRRLLSERTAVSLALEAVGGPFAILSAGNDVVFASTAIQDFLAADSGRAWKSGDSVEVAGAAFIVERTPLAQADGGGTLLIFRYDDARPSS